MQALKAVRLSNVVIVCLRNIHVLKFSAETELHLQIFFIPCPSPGCYDVTGASYTSM